MEYNFMYYQYKRGEKIMTVMDFNNGRLIHFDLEFLQSEKASEDLKEYMRTVWKNRVMNSQFEYKGKTPYR